MHIKGTARCILFFRGEKSFFYIRARERASFHLKDHAASISRNFFSQTQSAESRGRKGTDTVHSLPLPPPSFALSLFFLFLHHHRVMLYRGVFFFFRDCAGVDVPTLDEDSTCKQLHNDFGRRSAFRA